VISVTVNSRESVYEISLDVERQAPARSFRRFHCSARRGWNIWKSGNVACDGSVRSLITGERQRERERESAFADHIYNLQHRCDVNLRNNSFERSTRRARVPELHLHSDHGISSPLKSRETYSDIPGYLPRDTRRSRKIASLLDASRKSSALFIAAEEKVMKRRVESSRLPADKSSLSKSGPRHPLFAPRCPRRASPGSLPPHVQRRACATSDAYAPADPPGFPSAPCSSPLPGLVRRAYWLRWMHDAGVVVVGLSRLARWGWKCIRHCRDIRARGTASRGSSCWEGRGERKRAVEKPGRGEEGRGEGGEREREREGGRQAGRHESPVEEALYTGWILVRPSVSRPNSWQRRSPSNPAEHSQLHSRSRF